MSSEPPTARRVKGVPDRSDVQAPERYRKIVPAPPTAQIRSGPDPQMPSSTPGDSSCTGRNPLFPPCSSTPLPAIQTSLGPLAHTPVSHAVVPLSTTSHADPPQWSTAPLVPTA